MRSLLAQHRISVNGVLATDVAQTINQFSVITLDDECLPAESAHYVMLNKPKGVVSATRDDKHRTVIDLLDLPFSDTLHIVGRLDIQSTGLILLTNDGQWSRRFSLPSSKVSKHYRVTTEQVITTEQIAAFHAGIFFAFEGVTTAPAEIRLIDQYTADVTLTEGRYHQIRRMFGHFNNRVLSIHRYACGPYDISTLTPGEYRQFTPSA